ncbi:M16 family metallopeptidase [Hathewaya histolytica]|uniref:M16 family metallopeptidase n=1 Tax=Hathewaya histolytica TaxID=1498 RepID=UPI003B67859C
MQDKVFNSEIIKLENGLTIVTIKRDTGLISINLGVGVGAINETKEQKGISHFIEHMLFKGTSIRDNEGLNNELENLGGEYNAYTDYTCTVYTIDALKEELENSLDLLSDMLINSQFKEKEIEKERGVILSELRSSKDDIEELSFKRVKELAFSESPLRIDVLGTEEHIKSFNRTKLINYYKDYYVPNNSVISIVSSFEHNEVQALVKEYFSIWQNKTISKPHIKSENNKKAIFTSYKKDIEQSTIVYLYTFYGLTKEEELSLRVLNHRFGESSNSILFRELREKRGLAYDIYTHMDCSNNIKTLYIYTAVEEENVEDTLKYIDESISDIKNEQIKFDSDTLNLIKKVFKTSLISTVENVQELGHYALIQVMEDESIYEFMNDVKRLEMIKNGHIYDIARRILKDPTIHILKPEMSEEVE